MKIKYMAAAVATAALAFLPNQTSAAPLFVAVPWPPVGVCEPMLWVQTLTPNAVGVTSIFLPVGHSTWTSWGCNVTSVALSCVADPVVTVIEQPFVFM